MNARARDRPLCVTVIAENPETIDGLQDYLQGTGVLSHGTMVCCDEATIPSDITAVVLFPDEFDPKVLVTRLLSLRAARPQLRIVVVTSSARRFRPALDPYSESLLPVVLAKPAFGWTILDAVRGQAELGTP
jgi:hypothetical protein